MTDINITFSTSWYNLNSKFEHSKYVLWMNNMIPHVNNYYLVIYTDKKGYEFLFQYFEKHFQNPKIKICIKEMTDFYNYRYREKWIENHNKNTYLNTKTEWKLHMLWAEKIHFVDETAKANPFQTEFFGWCDIGYFRNAPVMGFPSPLKIAGLRNDKIYYACVNNNNNYMTYLINIIYNKTPNGLPREPIPPNQVSIAGGFFVTYKDNIGWWKNTFDEKLNLYFENHSLVKDDQIIIVDCVFSNIKRFVLITENGPFDNWFLFTRHLV